MTVVIINFNIGRINLTGVVVVGVVVVVVLLILLLLVLPLSITVPPVFNNLAMGLLLVKRVFQGTTLQVLVYVKLAPSDALHVIDYGVK